MSWRQKADDVWWGILVPAAKWLLVAWLLPHVLGAGFRLDKLLWRPDPDQVAVVRK